MFQSILIIALMTFSFITQAALPADPIQRCLDIRRLVDITSRQKMAAKEPGVLRFKFHKISASELPLDNPVGNMDEVIQALNNQIENCNNSYGEFQTVTIAGHQFKRQEWCLNTNKKMLTLAKAAQGDFKKFLSSIKTEFDWYKSDGWPENHAGFKKGEFQFTAYYAPAAVEARSKRSGAFLYPLYSNPGVVSVALESKKYNLKTPLCGVDPLSKVMRGFCLKNADGTYSVAPDREEIEHGALNPKYIIGYLKDPNDSAFLMLQGSGSLLLDGKLFHINYDGANGRPRTMLGRIVQCAQDPTCGGNLDTMERCAKDPKCHDEAKLRCNVSKKIRQSAASEKLIRQYLNNLTPDKADNLRNRDQSYVFFAKEDGGPYGSENISLTPHVSCATDHRVIPVGMNFIYHCKKATSWCVAQDAGGAIIGAHVDVYKGEGNQAGVEANQLNHTGTLFVALPKRK
ncbi:TPA: murein transglycosylase [Legionella pneumophila subsp. pneumophila]|uniref:MltA domain-containing protein n=1 Tax=Legionella pneumophila TaxID=446 RepID=UPI0007706F8D|nr:MltA domain-containing protein [Legionella pneumophila]HAT9694930.1 murein transglycosylase [Legionella pneumophila subsp. pneumophila]CZG91964.1 Membrane-bound lytic murein transglycosylase A precursor [Legionella pneumophila]CZI25636.1 Membrane-bound lytic murein transglycosylase A precursor [Legionella pneumophila]CZI27540.1 Membrane-bound lytic murein transglycosylase A precursor [Legionella pneumophila]CZI28125.1 Membrane-bound lytic murein transglycosylase A precursor [Legionella pneu